MIKRKLLLSMFIILVTQSVLALQERHLIILRHGEGDQNITGEYNSNPKHPKYKPAHLTDKGQEQVKKAADLLLTHGFDNRNISAVYVSPLPRALETANIVADIGVYSKDKIHVDSRLIETQAGDREGLFKNKLTKDSWLIGPNEAKSFKGESNEDVRKRMIAIYDEIEKKHKDGHVIFITHGLPGMELIDTLTHEQVRLETAQLYIVPLASRNQVA